MSKKERIVLIDSNALIHRAFHALPPLQTKKGEPVNAVYGFTSTLLKVLADLKPAYIAAAFDRKEETFRHKEYAEYKAQRVKAPEEIYEQIPKTKEVLESFSIPIFEYQGFEADDIIGTLAKQAQEKGLDTYIVTGDLDTLQLVSSKVKVYTLKRGIGDTVIYDEEQVRKRFNLAPWQLVDFKALKGDPSDNIPGVPGIGQKTAALLVSEFSSIENLYQEIEKGTAKAKKLPQRLQQNLKNYKEQAFFCKKLITLREDVPVKLDLGECQLHKYDKNEVFQLFQKLGFKSLLSRLPDTLEDKKIQSSLFSSTQRITSVPKPGEIIRHQGVKYQIVQNETELDKLVNQIKNRGGFAFDIEATSQEAMRAKLVGISLALREKEAYYLPLGHNFQNQKSKFKNLDLDKVLTKLKGVFEDSEIEKYGHNLKYDMLVLLNYKIKVLGTSFDSMIASYILHPTTRAHDLDSVAFTELGVQTLPLKALIGTGKKQISVAEVPVEKLGIYSCEDADLSFRLKNHFEKLLVQEKLDKVFYDIEIPLVSVLSLMEFKGVKIDEGFLLKMSSELQAKISNLEKNIYHSVGYQFNINSPQQLSSVLFEVLKLPQKEIKKTKTGISTAASELEKLKGTHPVIDFIIQYRELVKLKTTYLDALPHLINSTTGRLHTSFNQTATATGRLSSSDPNLQNIPIRGTYGGHLREAFVAEPGFKLLCADYSQIELRIIASLSRDQRMIDAFVSGEDIHTTTASEIFGVPKNEVTKEMRQQAKAINFGIIYGMSSHGLSQALGISHEEAREYIEKYFSLHSGIKTYIEETLEQARSEGYVKTVFGRKRPLPEINSSIFNVRAAAERMAINMPVQGTAADLIKIAMIRINNELPKVSKESRMILQVHDELVFEIPQDTVEKAAQLVKNIMENAYTLEIPLEVGLSVGDNWGEMEKLEL